MKIAVSIGHTLSGIDSGAVSILNESICTREIGEKVKTYLEQLGHTVVFCRIDSASTLNESLAYRVNKANAAGVDVFAEIHLNAGGGKGVETYALATGGSGEAFANKIQAALVELGYYNRGVKFANFYVLRCTNMPAVLIECGFVDSQEDCNRYNADAIARKIVKGLVGVEPSTVVQATATVSTSNKQGTALVYCDPVDQMICDFMSYALGGKEAGVVMINGNIPTDYSKYQRVICVGAKPTAFPDWTSYATDKICPANGDRIDTLIAALKFTGRL